MFRHLANSSVPPAVASAWRWGWRQSQVWRARRQLARVDRLHLGCGPQVMTGWGNLDLDGGPGSIAFDLTHPLPKPAGSVRFIYSEHFIEHLTQAFGASLLRECRRVLRSDGVLRISTPDLRFLVEVYRSGRTNEWNDMGWTPETPCRLLNESMRLWGHTFLYDEPELKGVLSEAGFSRIERVKHRQSRHSDLAGLETRPFHHDLIIEAMG